MIKNIQQRVIFRKDNEDRQLLFFPDTTVRPGYIAYWCGEHGDASIAYYMHNTKPLTISPEEQEKLLTYYKQRYHDVSEFLITRRR